MSEKPNYDEDQEITPENPEQRLISLLKERGPEDIETREALNKWLEEQERIADQCEDRNQGAIELNLKRARLYQAAGFLDTALENFNDAKELAWQCRKDELCREIQVEIDKIQ